MRKFLVVFILAAFAVPVLAETYTWTDERGTVNFTEDLGKVPKKYRKKVRRIGEAEPEPAAETSEAPRAKAAPPAEVRGAQQPVAQAKEEKKPRYGGRDASEWSNDFGRARAELKSAEDQLVSTRKQLDDTTKMSRNEYLSLQMTLKNMEKRVLELRQKLDDLDAAATKAEVPANLRQ